MPATLFTGLQSLTITGNPFALAKEYEGLERAVNESSSCAVINEPGSPLYYLRYPKKKERIP
jgi:hypothetical protein